MRQRLTTKHDAHCENAQKKLKLEQYIRKNAKKEKRYEKTNQF